jgi:hypothetical protein
VFIVVKHLLNSWKKNALQELSLNESWGLALIGSEIGSEIGSRSDPGISEIRLMMPI